MATEIIEPEFCVDHLRFENPTNHIPIKYSTDGWVEDRDEESTDIYKVMIRCEQYCETWEDTREMHRTSDPVEAIDRSAIMRDQLHVTWVERVDPREAAIEPSVEQAKDES